MADANGQIFDLAMYYLNQIRHGLSRLPFKTNDDDEPAPTELNTINSSGGFLVVSTDKLSLRYTNVNLHGYDVGVVQGNIPAPTRRLVYYFEIYVKDAGAKGQIAIGFTSDKFKMRRQPGWEANSCGYHGDDGLLYRGGGKGEAFGPTYTSGDVVGAGINYATQEFFFTKNGQVVGTVPKDLKGPLYPTIAVHSQKEEVQVNFGQKPFTFNLEEFEAQERMKQQVKIEEVSLPLNISHGIVRSYLLYNGYEETLKSFDQARESTVPPINIAQELEVDEQHIAYALNERKTLRQLIRNGEIDAAFSKLRDLYPHIVEVGELEEAIKYGRIELARFFGTPMFEDILQDCVALLAYERPQESSVGYLLKDSQREVVADAVNAMILCTNPMMKNAKPFFKVSSSLERLLRQLTLCCLEKRNLSGQQGEAFELKRILHGQ